jgi:assimilatory nitrate reductase catalytic subunit
MASGWTRTTCPYCGVGCGVLARPSADGGAAEIKGDPEHPANFGRLCSKGSALGETLSHDGRLLHPMIDGRRASWDEALDLVAGRFADAIAEHGPDSVAFYLSGQCLTEDYYVANKLAKGFWGTANIDTNSRLCMASSVAGHKRAFGSDTVPGCYEDLELADLVVLVGSNLAWCHPVLFQRLAAAREERGTKVVVIDPRETASCAIADLHLAIRPGADVALLNGLLRFLASSRSLDDDYIREHATGFAAALETAGEMWSERVAELTGLTQEDISRFYGFFAATERTVTVYSQGVNQSTAGTDKVNAIINCHLATGRIGKPGAGPFSVTGQPNAMGGREVGGLANMLAAHMELSNPEHRRIVQHFWASPAIASSDGLKAVDLFRAVGDGRIKALWIMSTNPVDSMPDADAARAALKACPFVVVSDMTAATDTAELAHVLLPAAAWGEKSGTVTNSERRISRQRPFLAPPGEAKPDWWQIAEVARRMGIGSAFAYDGPAAIFAEHAALSGRENAGSRDFDISGFAGLSTQNYDELAPFQWPRAAGGSTRSTRFFADGGFFTQDCRANFVPTPFRPPATCVSKAYPMSLNTGRVRDHWHTMTRTGRTPRLASHLAEPFVELHPQDATRLGLSSADLARVESARGSIVVRVVATSRQARGEAFVPMHWTEQFASGARVSTLVESNTDPISGQPELKHTPVRISRFAAVWYGFAVTPQRPAPSAFEYAAIAPCNTGWRLECAGLSELENWDELARSLLQPAEGAEDPVELLSYLDNARGQRRFAAFEGGRCVGLLYVAREPVAVSRTWAIDQAGADFAPEERLRLLAGRPGADMPDRGAIVCSCMNVGANEIAGAIARQGCTTVDAVGQCTGAGTNCGSCRSEIGRLLDVRTLAETG